MQCNKTRELEIDHIKGITWDARSKSQWGRVAQYVREARQGLVQVLCRSCNAAKGRKVAA